LKEPPVSDDRAFLQDILTHPNDDTPRLVYADWLEETGDPERAARAEFIRVQYALQGLPPGDARRPQLEERERDLRAAHEATWATPLRELGQVRAWEFRRGFVEKVTLRAADFLGVADRLFAVAPVRELRLDFDSARYDGTPRQRLALLRRLAASPHLGRLVGLEIGSASFDPLGRGEVRALAQSDRLVRLRSLALGPRSVSAAAMPELLPAPFLSGLAEFRLDGGGADLGNGLTRFLRSPRLGGLGTLALNDVPLGGEGLSALAESPALANLTSLSLVRAGLTAAALTTLGGVAPARLTALDLSGNDLTPAAARALARARLLAHLETLNLGMNRLGDEGVRALSRSPHLAGLVALDLSANQVGPDGAKALAASPHFARLVTLALRTNRLGDAGLAALTSGKGLAALKSLRVSYNNVGAAGVEALAAAFPGRLTDLDLSWGPFGDGAAQVLAAAERMGDLTALDLSYAQLGDGAAAALAGSPHLGRLQALNLSTNRIGDAGARALAASPHLGALTALNLGYNALGGDGARALAESPLFPRLTALSLAGNGLPPEWLAGLRRDFRGHLGG
jgi:uncharacterized protein (TIGR02996 family)